MLDGSVVLTPFDEAARRFNCTEEDLHYALANRWILGDPEVGVQHETVRKWLSGRKDWLSREERRKKREEPPRMIGLHILTDKTQSKATGVRKINVGARKYGT